MRIHGAAARCVADSISRVEQVPGVLGGSPCKYVMEAMCAGDGGVKQGEYSVFFRAGYLNFSIFLIQLGSASLKRPFSTGLFLDWILLVVLLIAGRVDFIVLVPFLEAGVVREYCCMAVENRLAALCFARPSRATRDSCATYLRRSGLVALG